MQESGLFTQTVIAVIWDFDKTLSPEYMQAPIFRAYGIDEAAFWDEVNALPAYYARAGVKVQPESCYLGHLLSCVQHGVMPGLTNARLRELGSDLSFYPGLPECFAQLQAILTGPAYRVGDQQVTLEHYVVSTGLRELIEGSALRPYLAGIWASEFIEAPAAPGADLSQEPGHGPIQQIATFLDHTTKTRAVFEINKGVNKEPTISVNDNIPENERRVPVRNMIYVADGPSDIPTFSVVGKHGGRTFAVYDPASKKSFAQAKRLLESERVDAFGPADYQPGTQTAMWLESTVEEIAQRIVRERKDALAQRTGQTPQHLKD